VFQISGRIAYKKDIAIHFWRGKVTVLMNLRELVPPWTSANCWDSKDPPGNLSSINVLTVQQISPHHKLYVYHILQVCAQELDRQSAWCLWHMDVNNLYIYKVMLLACFEVFLVYTAYVRQRNKLLTTPFVLRQLLLMTTPTFT